MTLPKVRLLPAGHDDGVSVLSAFELVSSGDLEFVQGGRAEFGQRTTLEPDRRTAKCLLFPFLYPRTVAQKFSLALPMGAMSRNRLTSSSTCQLAEAASTGSPRVNSSAISEWCNQATPRPSSTMDRSTEAVWARLSFCQLLQGDPDQAQSGQHDRVPQCDEHGVVGLERMHQIQLAHLAKPGIIVHGTSGCDCEQVAFGDRRQAGMEGLSFDMRLRWRQAQAHEGRIENLSGVGGAGGKSPYLIAQPAQAQLARAD